jgi:hypothetical protein
LIHIFCNGPYLFNNNRGDHLPGDAYSYPGRSEQVQKIRLEGRKGLFPSSMWWGHPGLKIIPFIFKRLESGRPGEYLVNTGGKKSNSIK